MNSKFGRDARYRENRFGDERWLRSPEQEFETSEPYRQPRGDDWNRPSQAPHHQHSGRRHVDYHQLGYAPSSYVPREAAPGGYAGRGPKGYVRSDERIREDVCDRLSWNDEVDATDIAVQVSGGEVTLEGTVETRHMKRLAEDIAEEVPGVHDVHNRVRVTKPMLTEIKEKITGEARDEHYANTGTKTTGAGIGSARNGIT